VAVGIRMECRFEFQIHQLDPLWRVTVRDQGRRMPDYCREYPSQDEAVAYAKGRALQMQVSSQHARVVLLSAGALVVLWASSGEVP
jgi:hypothetical protein